MPTHDEHWFQPAHAWKHAPDVTRNVNGRHVAAECQDCGIRLYATVRNRRVAHPLEVSPPGAQLDWCPVSGRDHRQHKGAAE